MRWLKGDPPTPGWYIASACRKTDTYRWWNGVCWSEACHPGDPIALVIQRAMRRCNYMLTDLIEWIKP